MATIYEIEGDLITRVTRQIEQVGRLSDLLPTLTSYKPIEVGYLPRDCSYIHITPTPQDTVEALVIVAQPPQTRRIVFNETHGPLETQRAYALALPYHLFWFRMHGTPQVTANLAPRMLWAPRHWATLWMQRPPQNIATDQAIGAIMPNTWPDGRVCFGNNPVSANQTMGQYIDSLVNTYWTSVFNTDLAVRTPYGQSGSRANLQRWQTQSQSQPDVWRTWDAWRGESPIRNLIEAVDGTMWNEPMPDSTEPVIPQTPRTWTFHSVRNWLLSELDEQQRNRLLWALQMSDIEAVAEAQAEDEPEPAVSNDG